MTTDRTHRAGLPGGTIPGAGRLLPGGHPAWHLDRVQGDGRDIDGRELCHPSTRSDEHGAARPLRERDPVRLGGQAPLTGPVTGGEGCEPVAEGRVHPRLFIRTGAPTRRVVVSIGRLVAGDRPRLTAPGGAVRRGVRAREPDVRLPLRILVCPTCWLVQLDGRTRTAGRRTRRARLLCFADDARSTCGATCGMRSPGLAPSG